MYSMHVHLGFSLCAFSREPHFTFVTIKSTSMLLLSTSTILPVTNKFLYIQQQSKSKFPPLLMSLCFAPYIIITRPFQKHKNCFVKSTSTILPITSPNFYTYNNKMSLNSSSHDENMLRSPHHKHSSLTTKSTSLSPHQPSHRIPPKSSTYNSTMSLVSSSPHENMLRLLHPHHLSLSKNLNSASSNISLNTTKILHIQITK
mgnify:CR=1 FL=1